jgi:hypothetical protein
LCKPKQPTVLQQIQGQGMADVLAVSAGRTNRKELGLVCSGDSQADHQNDFGNAGVLDQFNLERSRKRNFPPAVG